MTEKTIENTNFVAFMHEVVAAVKDGYSLTFDPKHAPSSTPTYFVVLVQGDEKPSFEDTLDEVEVITKAVVEDMTTQEKLEVAVETAKELDNVVTEAIKPAQKGRPRK